MVDIIDGGWLWLTDGVDYLKLACVEIEHDIMVDPKIEHYFGGTHTGYDLGKKWLVVKISQIKCKSHTDFSTIIDTLMDWQAAETITLSIVRNTSNNKIELDGDNTNFPVLIAKPGLKGLKKTSPDNQDRYELGSLKFEQIGAAS